MEQDIDRMQRAVLESIARRRDPDAVLEQLCRMIEQVIPDSWASVLQLDTDGRLVFRCRPSLPDDAVAAFGVLRPGPRAGSCGTAVHEGCMVIVADTRDDPRWTGLTDVVERFGVRSCWSVPITPDGGSAAGSFGISRPVTGEPTEAQRRMLETAAYLAGIVLINEGIARDLRSREALTRAIVDCSSDAIHVKDADGRYRLVNEAAAKLRGATPAELLGRREVDFFGGGDLRRIRAAERRAFESGESVVELVQHRPCGGGTARECLVRTDPLRDADGRIIGTVGISRDLTDQRVTERALQQHQRNEGLSALAGGIAHDFNNLLVGILANASLLDGMPAVRDSALAGCVEDIQSSARRAAELTQQLLEFAGEGTPERRPLDVHGLCLEVEPMLRGSLGQRVRLEFHVPDDLPPVLAGRQQVAQVLTNLVLNGSEAYGDSAGVVEVRARLRPATQPSKDFPVCGCDGPRDWIELEVEDRGAGMDGETVERAFDPFFSTRGPGRGLGLAAVQGIVEAHGGCLDVQSRPGEGSTFRVWLPLADQGVATGCCGEQPSGRGHVLLVEDDEVIAKVTERIVARLGYRCTIAGDGAQGLRAFEAGDFTCVIVDESVPGMSGRELARRIRAIDADVPMVLTSGFADRVATGPGEFIDAFLAKPFLMTDIAAAIERAVAAGRDRGRATDQSRVRRA